MPLTFAAASENSTPLHFVSPDQTKELPESIDADAAQWAKKMGFTGSAGQVCIIPDATGDIQLALVGMGDETAQKRKRFIAAGARSKLPNGTYHIESGLDVPATEEAALGWLMAGYSFDTYRKSSVDLPGLIAPASVDAAGLELIASAEKLTRDLINTPANDMGPIALEAAATGLAGEFGAKLTVISGKALKSDFPMIHTVGRASDQEPRLIDFEWGASGPKLTLVGKGVCFDTGGLNIKPGASMGLMKKDLGGAANVLGLARMIMGSGANVRLRVLIPAVENSISAGAFRPGDILTSRKGLTVEINNTDAEGRLVLADALALADEDNPDLIISMATLTGAARVAVGPDLAPFYATADSDAQAVEAAAKDARDPVWRMPFWDPYEAMIEPGIADLDNAPKGGFAGSITAALFLRRFVTDTARYMHFDIFGWNPTAAPARAKGGSGQGIRALFRALPDLMRK